MTLKHMNLMLLALLSVQPAAYPAPKAAGSMRDAPPGSTLTAAASNSASASATYSGAAPLSSQTVPQNALTSSGPAIAVLGTTEYVAWEGVSAGLGNPVYYETFDGTSYSSILAFGSALTMTAPALGSVGTELDLATTPPNSQNGIYVQQLGSGGGIQVCTGTVCAQTLATPALASDGTTLYLAWTATNGSIRYATRSGPAGSPWSIATLAVPQASSLPTNGPSLAFYNNALYVAWLTPSGQTVQISKATLPLTSASWSHSGTIPAQTNVAPALGVLTSPANTAVLTLAWTITIPASPTPPNPTVGFAQYEPATSSWLRSTSPFTNPSIPPGLRTPFPLALSGSLATSDACINTIVASADFPTAATAASLAAAPSTAASATSYSLQWINNIKSKSQGQKPCPPPQIQ